MLIRRKMVFVDGENLLNRYEAMLKEGSRPKTDHVIHEPGKLVWSAAILAEYGNIIRVGYYTSIVGDDDEVTRLRTTLRKQTYTYHTGIGGARFTGNVTPKVYKKPSKQTKSHKVDINIAIDVLRHAYNDDCDEVVILSGDGDFIPLIEEAQRRGKLVCGAALSSGLAPELPIVCDAWVNIDSEVFHP